MGIKNSCVSYTGLVEKYIGTAYDVVKYVADNMANIVYLSEILAEMRQIYLGTFLLPPDKDPSKRA